jgi:hypothetical protein
MPKAKREKRAKDPIVSAVGMTKQLVERWEEADTKDEVPAGQPNAEPAGQFDPEVVEMYRSLVELEHQRMLTDLAHQSDSPESTGMSAAQAQGGRD